MTLGSMDDLYPRSKYAATFLATSLLIYREPCMILCSLFSHTSVLDRSRYYYKSTAPARNVQRIRMRHLLEVRRFACWDSPPLVLKSNNQRPVRSWWSLHRTQLRVPSRRYIFDSISNIERVEQNISRMVYSSAEPVLEPLQKISNSLRQEKARVDRLENHVNSMMPRVCKIINAATCAGLRELLPLLVRISANSELHRDIQV